MNPWGLAIAFAGFVILYIGVHGTQSSVIAAFRPKTSGAGAAGASSDFTVGPSADPNGKTRETPQ